jgi:hypothetical protein
MTDACKAQTPTHIVLTQSFKELELTKLRFSWTIIQAKFPLSTTLQSRKARQNQTTAAIAIPGQISFIRESRPF